MTITGYGTLARHVAMQMQMTSVKGDLDRLSLELASGLKSDIADSVGGDFQMLNDITRQLNVLNSYDQAVKDAQLFTDTMQTTMDRIQTMSADLSADLMTVSAGGVGDSAATASDAARQDFDTLISALNIRSGDKSLFAGAAVDSAATISAEDMMTHLSAAVAGAATVNDVITIVDDWFMSSGGGFETVGYLGSADYMSEFRLNEEQSASAEIKADDPEIRLLMRDMALASIANDPGLALTSNEKLELLGVASESLLSNQDAVTQARAGLGYAEERIEVAATANAATRTSLSMTQNEIVAVDSTEVAGKFQAAQYQLEMIYTVTSRLHSLSLMDYMR